MPLPDATAVRQYLEGYQITSSVLSDDWINNEIFNNVIPYIERYCRVSLMVKKQYTEWYSGNGASILMLNRRNIGTLDSIALVRGSDFLSYIALDAIDVDAAEGVLKARTRVSEGYYFSIFPKGENNLRITYTMAPALDGPLTQAILFLACNSVLALLADRTGGGNLSTEGWSRDFGNMGKFTNIRKRLDRMATSIMNDYRTSVIGA